MSSETASSRPVKTTGLHVGDAVPGVKKHDPILTADGVKRTFGGLTAVDIEHVEIPRGAITEVRAEVADLVRRTAPGATLADFGHVGDGGLHLNVVLAEGTDAAALRSAVYDVVERHGGSFSAEHGLGPVNVDRWRQQSGPGAMAALAAVKRALDPYGLLGTDALRAALTTTPEGTR